MLFYKKGGHLGSEYLKLGSYSNASTSLDGTIVYSTANFNLIDILCLLIKTLFEKPDFTIENIEKERKIIATEIIKETGYYNHNIGKEFLRQIYEKHPIRDSIVGDLNSIAQIDESLLDDAYNAFYTPDNISLYFMGQIENEAEIIRLLQKLTPDRKKASFEKRYSYFETNAVDTHIEIINDIMIHNDECIIGFKEPIQDTLFSSELIKRDICLKITSSILSKLLVAKLNEVTIPFSMNECGPTYGYMMYLIISKNPLKYSDFDWINNYVLARKENKSFTEEQLKQLKFNLMYSFDSFEATLLTIIGKDFLGVKLEDYETILDQMTYEKISLFFLKNSQ